MEYLVTKTIPKEELTEYKDYVNFLFKNENNVFNICTSVEDIMKTNQWFNNLPLATLVVSNDEIKIGDVFLAVCNNQELNGKTFLYKGDAKVGEGLIEIEGKIGVKLTTPEILTKSYKFVRKSTFEDRMKLVNGNITEYSI